MMVQVQDVELGIKAFQELEEKYDGLELALCLCLGKLVLQLLTLQQSNSISGWDQAYSTAPCDPNLCTLLLQVLARLQ